MKARIVKTKSAPILKIGGCVKVDDLKFLLPKLNQQLIGYEGHVIIIDFREYKCSDMPTEVYSLFTELFYNNGITTSIRIFSPDNTIGKLQVQRASMSYNKHRFEKYLTYNMDDAKELASNLLFDSKSC